MYPRVVRRPHHLVVLLQLDNLGLELTARHLVILVGLLQVFVALTELRKLELGLIVQSAQVLTLPIPALQLLAQTQPFLLQLLNNLQLVCELAVFHIELIVHFLLGADAAAEGDDFLFEVGNFALRCLLLTAIFAALVADECVEADVLALEKLVVALHLVELVLQARLLLKSFLVITVELLEILYEQTMFIGVVALHFPHTLFLLFFPRANKSLNFRVIFAAQVIRCFGRQARRHCAIRILCRSTVAHLLDLSQVQIGSTVGLENGLGQVNKLSGVLQETLVEQLLLLSNVWQKHILTDNFGLLGAVLFCADKSALVGGAHKHTRALRRTDLRLAHLRLGHLVSGLVAQTQRLGHR